MVYTLKIFVKDAQSGAPFTGYLVKEKGLHYYEVNKVGVKINRSSKIMHTKFKELLADYTINPLHIEPLKIQLQYTWENLTESYTSEKKTLSLKLNEVEKDLYILRERHALGKIDIDVYKEFSIEMKTRKEAIAAQLEKLSQKLSNPNELICFALKLTSNLQSIWDSGDYYQKQLFQNTLFPKGLVYDSKIDDYRTPVVNDLIGYVSHLSSSLRENKNGTLQNLSKKSRSVPGAGLEPARL